MTTIAHFRRVLLPLIAIASVLAASSSFAVTMDVTAGFDGVTRDGVWTPIAVQLKNTSSESVEGTLVVTQKQDSHSGLPVCTSVVNLPANSSSKLYYAYVRTIGYGNNIDVALVDGGNELVKKSVVVNPIPREDRLIVSVGERSSRLAFLQGEIVAVPLSSQGPQPRYSGSSSTATLHAGSVLPTLLPDRPAAYEGVNVLVISGLDPSAVRPNALKAIKMWVASGGTLVVSTGADYQRYTNEFYTEMLPVSVTGATNLAGVTGMTSLGKVDFPAGPVAIAQSNVKPGIGSVIAAENGVPLVAERTYGVGRVVFLAFDYKTSPFRDWNGQTDFWKSIVERPTDTPVAESITISPQEYTNYSSYGSSYPPGYGPQMGSVGMTDIVAQNPSVKMPSFGTIGSFLLAYLVVLVPINYFVLKRRRRLEFAWVTTPVIVIAFTVGAYAIGYTMKGGQLRLREACVIEGSSDARYARMVTNASIFSPSRTTYDVQVKDPSAISQVVVFEERAGFTPAYMNGDSTKMSVDMAMWSSKSLEAVGGIDLGGTIKSQLTLDGDHLQGTLTNGTTLALRECKLAYGGSWVDVPAIAPGASVPIDVSFANSSGTTVGSSEVNSALSRFTWDRVQKSAGPVLLAFTDSDNAVFDMPDESPTAERGRLCVFHLNYEIGGSFMVPSSSISWQMVDAQNVDASYEQQTGNEARANFYSSGKCTFVFAIPAPDGSKINTLHLAPGGDLSGVGFSLLDCESGQWVPVALGAGKDIAKAAKYVSAGNQVKVKVDCKSSGYHSGVTLRLSADGVGH